MNQMFYGCSNLDNLYLYGISTANLKGYRLTESSADGLTLENDNPVWTIDGVESSGMRDIFGGCTKLLAAPTSDDPNIERASVTVGPWATKLFNGFFWYRDNVSSAPLYVLGAEVYVYGGPNSVNDLMTRPNLEFDGNKYVYTGIIYLRNNAAIANLNSWIARDYIEYATGSNDIRPADAAYGTLEASGNLGYAGEYTRPSDVEFNKNQTVTDGGTSVRWSLRRDPSTNVGTLSIFPADNDWGYMRAFGAAERAPWDGVDQAIGQDFSQVVFLNRVRASGDCERE